jgi:hypothetical protein
MAWLVVALLMVGGLSGRALAADPQVGNWTGGAAIGMIGNTPDGTALGLNFNAERFMDQHVSLGPLVQLGFTGDLTQVGVSGQAKYWIDLPDPQLKLNFQGGIGFVHADMRGASDTSFLVPIGVGLDYKVSDTFAVTSNFMLNFTDLSVAGHRTTVMPAFTVGFRF